GRGGGVDLFVLETPDGFGPVHRGFDLVARSFEPVAHDFADPGLVVHDEDPAQRSTLGSRISKRVPPPGACESFRLPPFNSTRLRAIESPRPLPGTLRAEPSPTSLSNTRSRGSRVSPGTRFRWLSVLQTSPAPQPATEFRTPPPAGE